MLCEALHKIHIHIGADPLDSRSYRWNRLLKIFSGFEDVLYRMASGGQSRGEFRGTQYAAPIASIIPSNFFRNRQTDETEIKQHIRSRYHGLNFQNANPGSDKNTVEFRLWNGSLDCKQIQANVKMSMGIVHAADIVRRTNESTRERNELIPGGPMKYGQAVATERDLVDHTEIRRLLDLLFVRNKDKAAVLWLYASSEWQG
ncbi:MAG: putative amidoligase enzyme [Pelotomaculum sp. PtaU1.Bin065]|nr:MAG: putative amidoligase enzyme [Pelotomaculum sp. PtaU1.Bin065]